MRDTDTDAIDAVGSLVPQVASAARYGASYFPQSIRDAAGRKIDEYAGPASADPQGNILHDAYGLANQAAAGFNKGVGNLAFLPVDAVGQRADWLTNKVADAFGMNHLPRGPSAHDLYNRVAVDSAGEPQSIAQRLVRAGGEGVGSSAIPMAGMLGVAGSGLRSGVTLAERAAAPGLDALQAAPSVGGILGRLKDFGNAADPRNLVNAFRPMNMQASADRVLSAAAANPGKTAVARSWWAFRKGAHQRTPPQYANADDPSQ
jgi:hypothetical protein